MIEAPDGRWRRMTKEEIHNNKRIPQGWRIFSAQNFRSQNATASDDGKLELEGRVFHCGDSHHWKTNSEGRQRLTLANRLLILGSSPNYKRYFDDYPIYPITDRWDDTAIAGFSGEEKVYTVQTASKVIERCLLMTTDPGDLILDPTCGSGTTAEVAEKWGRRWIAIDTSRVAVTLARQRLLTGTFDYYKLRDEFGGVGGGFINKTVPHIQLGGIAQNTALDPIFAKHESILKEKLETLNRVLGKVTPEIQTKLLSKLPAKERSEGKKAVTDADRRRWQLPQTAW